MKQAFLVEITEKDPDQVYAYLVNSDNRVTAARDARKQHAAAAHGDPGADPGTLRIVNVEPKREGESHLARVGGRKVVNETRYPDREAAVRAALAWLKQQEES